MIALVLAVLIAAPPPAPRSAGAPADAAALRRRLAALTADINARVDRQVVETAGLAGPGRKKGPLLALLDAQAAALQPLVLESAVLAERLRRYETSGTLAPLPPAEVARLGKLLASPWKTLVGDPLSRLTPVREFSLDLRVLRRQLAQWGRPPAKDAPPAPRLAPRPTALPEAEAPRPAARREAPFAARMTAAPSKRAHDAVPDLLVQLASVDPRERALAADQLGAEGPAASRAVPALRRALKDPDRRVRASAVLALAGVGDRSAAVLSDIRALAFDRDEEVRLSAGLAVGRLAP